MKTWFDLVREKLKLNWLLPFSSTIPFSLIVAVRKPWTTEFKTFDRITPWIVDSLEALTSSHWQLKAHTPRGLAAVWNAVFFDNTRAFECWGEVTNRGLESVKGVLECITWDVALPLSDEVGQPWIRTMNGVRFIPTFFPPYDFAIVDRQFLRTPQVFDAFPLTYRGLQDGRPSGESLPYAILANEKQTYGLTCFLEWSGLWRMSFCFRDNHRSKSADECNEQASTLASIKTDGLDLHRYSPVLEMQVGLSGLDLNLEHGQTLPFPRVLVTAFDGDLESGGNSLRRHIRQYVTPDLCGEKPLPPTSFNHWFAFGNDFTEDLLKPAVEACVTAGLEYFCIDTGWFENGFRIGVGNWTRVDRKKFPEGIESFSQYVRGHKMKFGIWFEPEWAHHTSEIYQQHPEWFWPSPEILGTLYDRRWFDPPCHLINFGLKEVQQWWLDRICYVYEKWGVEWVRWDFNQMPRPNWENGILPGQVGWRQIQHIQGFYKTIDEILKACPKLFLEQCAGGGHRIELGTARRGHSFWMNDHTTHSDIVRALQHGLNTILPGN